MATSGTRDLNEWARSLSRRDWIITGCGVLVLIASFLPWEAASGGLYTNSASAWNSGFGAWFGSLLCAAAAAAVAARHLGYLRGVGTVGPNLVVCGLAGVGAALLIIRLLTLPRGTGGLVGVSGSYDYGPSFGAFAGVGLAVVQAIVALLNVRTSGEKLPALTANRTAPVAPAQAPPPPHTWNAAQAQPSARPTWDAAQAQARGEYAQPASYGQPGGYSPAAPKQAGTERPPTDQNLAQRLARLDDLRARGLISDAEHADQRRRIISQL